MRAINHALTGAVIGLTVHNPAVALPAALVSHLVCDAIPHHGSAAKDAITSRWFAYSLVIDALLCGALVFVLYLSGTNYWLLASVCAFLAASPDFLSVRKYVASLQGSAVNMTRKPCLIENGAQKNDMSDTQGDSPPSRNGFQRKR